MKRHTQTTFSPYKVVLRRVLDPAWSSRSTHARTGAKGACRDPVFPVSVGCAHFWGDTIRVSVPHHGKQSPNGRSTFRFVKGIGFVAANDDIGDHYTHTHAAWVGRDAFTKNQSECQSDDDLGRPDRVCVCVESWLLTLHWPQTE